MFFFFFLFCFLHYGKTISLNACKRAKNRRQLKPWAYPASVACGIQTQELCFFRPASRIFFRLMQPVGGCQKRTLNLNAIPNYLYSEEG